MRTEVADNWIAMVDRFAASSLRMIFVGQTGLLMHFADFGERLCDIVKKCKHPCLISSLVDVFKPYRLCLCGSLCFPRVVFYSSIITLSFMPRNDFFRP